MKILTLFFLSILSCSAQAHYCSPKNNADSSLETIHDQGRTDWCYAYAAADLLSFKLKKRISAVDLAYIYNQEDPDQNKTRFTAMKQYDQNHDLQPLYETAINGGDAADAINDAKKYGVCLDKDLPSDDRVDNDIMSAILQVNKLKQAMTEDPQMCQFHDYFHSFERFPGLPLTDALNVIYHSSQTDVLAKLAQRQCQGKRIDISQIQTHKFEVNKKHPQTRSEAFNQIDVALDSGSIAAVSFKARLLWPGNKDDHQTVLVGREYDNKKGQCEYIIRDSNGADHSTDSHLKNKNGYYWVPESQLKKYLEDVTTID